MKYLKFINVIFSLTACSLFAQEYRGSEAASKVYGSQEVYFNIQSSRPAYIKFNDAGKARFTSNISASLKIILSLTPDEDLVQVKSETDNINYTHIRYQQHYMGIPVEGGIYIAHIKNGVVESANGAAYDVRNVNTVPAINEKIALANVLNIVRAKKYKWENQGEIEMLRKVFNTPDFNYDPKGELVLFPMNGQYTATSQFVLAYKFDIYAEEPESRANYFIDAQSGKLLGKFDLIQTADSKGTAQTKYSGTQPLTTDSVSATSFRLRETGRGKGIETWNVKTAQSTTGAVDFTDTDNNWNNVNTQKDEAATDAHTATEWTYDYYKTKYGRNSIDGNGFKLLNYVHWGVNWYNASWNGTYMRYGDGNGKPLTAPDVGGHEMTHGLTSNSAKLVYQDEPGGLNESFSDIFGNSVERFGRPAKYSWNIGEDFGTIRNMANPKQYNNPNTYKGTYWVAAGGSDNGGVHTNSGVQNYWYYLLTEGGTGTNDNSNNYTVTGIGIDKAGAIAFRNLTVYLTANSQYADARFYAIKAATDLYGVCSQEAISTTDAWYAVGVGAKFDPSACSNAPVSDFSADVTTTCTGAVNFKDLSTFSPTSWSWTFGDGGTSTLQNPTHTYTVSGTFNVVLTATNANGSNTKTKTAYVTVNIPTAPVTVSDSICAPGVVNLSASGSNTLNWYTAASGGTLVNTGTTYSPSLSTTTTFYVADEISKPVQNIGEVDNSKAGGFYTATTDRRLVFDVLANMILKSVKVYANTAGNRDIEVVNSAGTQVAVKTVNLPAGMSTVTLNFNLVPGTNYGIKIATGSTVDLFRNSVTTGMPFPYTINNLVTIKTSDAATNPNNYYYFFYDWQVQEPSCSSALVPVTGSVISCTGVSSVTSSNNFTISPNPASNVVRIEKTAVDDNVFTVEVLNVMGEKIYSTTIENKQGTFNRSIDISSFSPGLYFISLKGKNSNTTKKLVIE